GNLVGATYLLSPCLPAHHLETIFLWIFRPSFSSALTMLGDGQHQTVLNMSYSLTAGLSTFALSALFMGDGRLDMVHIPECSTGWRIVVGTSSEMMLTSLGALAAGFLDETVSTLGCKFFMPILESKFKVQDTCGIHNLHGMPGVLEALLEVLVAGLATHEAYGDGLQNVFPLSAEGQRSAPSQAMHQLFRLFITLTFASVGGDLGGLRQRLPFLDARLHAQCYEDQIYCEVLGEHEDEVQGPLREEEPDTQKLEAARHHLRSLSQVHEIASEKDGEDRFRASDCLKSSDHQRALQMQQRKIRVPAPPSAAQRPCPCARRREPPETMRANVSRRRAGYANDSGL
ncbi:LOW QUALITY PROTEIN: ammonium transporter Rh type B, partial [Rhynchonycteris naso]